MILLSLKSRASVQSPSKALREAMAKELLGTGLQVACRNQLNRPEKVGSKKKQKHVRRLFCKSILDCQAVFGQLEQNQETCRAYEKRSATDLHTYYVHVYFLAHQLGNGT